MAATQTLPEPAETPATPTAGGLLISLSPLPPEALVATLANLEAALGGENVLIATADPVPQDAGRALLRVVTYSPAVQAPGGWLLTAADYMNVYRLSQEHRSAACLLLGAEAQQLAPEALRALADACLHGRADLTAPRYRLGPRDGLVNSAILYPVTRALFATRQRFPLPVDQALSCRMAERLATVAQRYTAANQPGALIWPVAEAAAAGFIVAEVPAGRRALPAPGEADLNSLLAQVAGSFFADIDAKAGFWQRARPAYAPPAGTAARQPGQHAIAQDPEVSQSPEMPEPPNVQPMLDSFRLAYSNLQEIWSLVLPPNSLLGLKKLSLLPPAEFRMGDALWVRIVYDFILAHRLRTINRGHLLGALTPLYLAWVASHLLQTGGVQTGGGGTDPEDRIETLAAAFEADKPYLVSRWRWPDRFNP